MHEFTREDYEHAARAAGLEVVPHLDRVYQHTRFGTVEWNPATDDGDALRMLAAISYRTKALRLMFPEFNDGWAVIDDYSVDVKSRAHDYQDPCKAVREAAMRFAIKVGKSMAQKGHHEHR